MATERLTTSLRETQTTFEQKAVAYEPRFDQKIGLESSYILRQIDTFLGERLNVLLSKIKYEIKDNLMYGEYMDEPFIEVMKRGVFYRQKVGGQNRIDRKREESEIEGFLKTEQVMCNKNTPVGTTMLSVSPKGEKNSLYQHNFYDIFTLKEENGKRFVEARRYSSALSLEEYKNKLSPLSFMGNAVEDADFLSNPIKIDDVFFGNADQVHSYLHRNHDFMSVKEFQSILLACESLKQEYIRTRSSRVLDAIMNKADSKAGLIKHDFFIGSILLRVDQEIDYYGNQPVRQVATGCGASGGFSKNGFGTSINESDFSNPFSVSEFATCDECKGNTSDSHYHCPQCRKKYADETDKEKEERTKQCNCGFEFGC